MSGAHQLSDKENDEVGASQEKAREHKDCEWRCHQKLEKHQKFVA